MNTNHESRITNHERGFTLIEVLITIGLVALVIGLVYTTLYLSSVSVRDSQVINQKTIELLKAYNQLRRQFIGLYQPTRYKTSDNQPQTQQVKEKNKFIKVNITPQGDTYIVFFTTSSVFYPTTAQVEYQILNPSTPGENPYLTYKELQYPDCVSLQPKEPIVLSKYITGFKVEFLKDNLWQDRWDYDDPPEKIKVTLQYKRKDIEEKFSFVITPGISVLKSKVKIQK